MYIYNIKSHQDPILTLHLILATDPSLSDWLKPPDLTDWVLPIRLALSSCLIHMALSHVLSQLLHGFPAPSVAHINLLSAAPPSPLCSCAADGVVSAAGFLVVDIVLISVTWCVQPSPLKDVVCHCLPT